MLNSYKIIYHSCTNEVFCITLYKHCRNENQDYPSSILGSCLQPWTLPFGRMTLLREQYINTNLSTLSMCTEKAFWVEVSVQDIRYLNCF